MYQIHNYNISKIECTFISSFFYLNTYKCLFEQFTLLLTFESSLLFESAASLDDFGSGALEAAAGGAPEDAEASGLDAGAAAGAAAGASAFGASAAAAGAAGASFFASSGLAASFLSSFLSEAPFSFAPSAAVGKRALIVAVLRGTLFFFSFRNQLLKPPT